MLPSDNDYQDDGHDIAVVGMAGRFPRAPDLEAFWANLRDGVECVARFSPEELAEVGVDPALIADPHYVPARAVLEEADHFDAGFFGLSPKEAELTDPQHRLFLECAWHALEDAGCDPARYDGLIGVYAGCDVNAYTLHNLMFGNAGLQGLIGNDKDYLATRVCYKLNLRGPGVSVQTACSTSLVAVQMATQALLGYQCDVALAGGVGVAFPQRTGYLYQEGGILSPDGHCRPFDAAAQGTVGGDGVGVVALKRLADARRDGDPIHAVIKGAAVNNDGAAKVGFTAPSVQGQVEVIAMALAGAGVEPDSIGYVETHGTGTVLGDPIEITALSEAYRAGTDRRQYCALGSLKSNVGHMNSAAGIGSLLKTILALRHRQIPPSLNFTAPNPRIDFAATPFYVNSALRDWPRGTAPRRAAVSSFGIGGTNAHLVLEEAPEPPAAPAARAWQVLPLSTRSEAALDAACRNLADHLERHPEQPLADVAYTLQSGRRLFAHRRWLVCRERDEAVRRLRGGEPGSGAGLVHETQAAEVVFLFPGQGAQSAEMARELYAAEPLFRQVLDQCLERLSAQTGRDLRPALLPEPGDEVQAAALLEQTELTQPLLFSVEYALARLWQSWGVQPAAMIGHSLGEYTAACLAGVFSLDDALELVAARGRLMQAMAPGAMLAVSLPEAALHGRFPELAIAAVNGPAQCVLAGTEQAIGAAEATLGAEGVATQRLHTSHAFHSPLMEPMLEPFRAVLAGVALAPPQIPCISNLSGTWLRAEEATDPDYWVRHARQPVRFADGLGELLTEPGRVFLEVGPGRTLTALAAKRPERTQPLLNSLPGPRDEAGAVPFILATLAHLHCLDVPVDWRAVHGGEARRRVSLPAYPFERRPYRIDWAAGAAAARSLHAAHGGPEGWLYRAGWKSAAAPAAAGHATGRPLVFMDADGLGRELLPAGPCIEVLPGDGYRRLDEHRFTIAPGEREDYARLFAELAEAQALPGRVLFLWGLGEPLDAREECLALVHLARALADAATPVQLEVITRGVCDVTGDEPLVPEHATLLGPAQVLAQEYPQVRCRVIDLEDTGADRRPAQRERLAAELAAAPDAPLVALRGRRRWVPAYEPAHEPAEAAARPLLRPGGTYLLTGGLGNIGLTLAEHLVRAGAANLVLTSRGGLPPSEEWEQWLAYHAARDPVSVRIRRVQALEALGARVLVVSADAADREQMEAAVALAGERFGRIDGAVHCAGVVDPRELLVALRDTGPAQVDVHFRAKVDGARVLAQVLPAGLDFCLLCSSLSTVLGGVGFAAYAAANHFLDAFAAQRNRAGGCPWISVDWDGWATGDGEAQPALARFALTPQQGSALFERILHRAPESRWVVAAGDLAARIALGEARNDPPPDGEPTAGVHAAGEAHDRPELDTEYVAPRDELEEAIAAIWRQVLGFERIGVEDNFFSLGGDSLAAIQLSSRLNHAFGVEVSVHNLFEEPTIAALARRIAELRREAEPDEDELQRVLELVEGLSEEEVANKLAELGIGE